MASLLLTIGQTIYFLLPAYAANMAPVFNKYFWKTQAFYPMDFGFSWKGKRILGSHKTWNGFLAGVLAAIAISYLQFLVSSLSFPNTLSLLPYDQWALIGILFGCGSLGGDAIKSFFKRRLSIKPGSKWIPFDQLDFIMGSLLLVSLFFPISLTMIISSLAVSFILHIVVNHIGHMLKMRDTPW